MGLDNHAIRFLLSARGSGINLGRVATLGRQSLMLTAAELAQELAGRRLDLTEAQAQAFLDADHGFCEPLLKFLGAGEVVSIDASPYQHASTVHDMNQPLPEDLHDRFDLVIDGGTLEHVFNFPQAIANCMNALAPAGSFLGITPANNFMGHGFYQLSPELYLRVFSPENGFTVRRLVMYESEWPSEWYEVTDPQKAGRRVTLTNRYPTQLLVHATKQRTIAPFASFPQQSDYAAWWGEAGQDGSGPSLRLQNPARPVEGALTSLRGHVVKLVPRTVKDRYHRWRAGGDRFDSSVFRKVDG